MFLLTLMAVSVFQGLGTFIVALERQFGWSRTTLNGAFALARVQGAVIGPVEGLLIDRLGSRRMILIGYGAVAERRRYRCLDVHGHCTSLTVRRRLVRRQAPEAPRDLRLPTASSSLHHDRRGVGSYIQVLQLPRVVVESVPESGAIR